MSAWSEAQSMWQWIQYIYGARLTQLNASITNAGQF